MDEIGSVAGRALLRQQKLDRASNELLDLAYGRLLQQASDSPATGVHEQHPKAITDGSLRPMEVNS